MNIFFISDTHFGHKNILKFEALARPFATIEDHDEELIKRWNSVVNKKDIVYHLGDVCWGSKHLATLDRLRGDKRLVMGNHDMYPTTRYLQYFTKLYGSIAFPGFIATHIPLSSCSLERYGKNVHGHLHSKTIDDPRYVNVSVEQIHLTPLALEEINDRH